LIFLERSKSKKIALYEAFIRRSPSSDMNLDKIKVELSWLKSGMVGEERVDREWLDIHIKFPHVLLHGLIMENSAGFTHQIDTVFICQHFILVIEIKNYSGHIEFDENTHQCIKKNAHGEVEGFHNPVDQVRRHRNFIRQIILNLGYDLPIESAVIFANSKSILGKVSFHDVLVFHVVGLRYKLNMLIEKHRKIILSKDEMELIGHCLKTMRLNKEWIHNLNKDRLQKGVLCSKCFYSIVMQFHHGSFICPRCGNRDRKELYDALDDFRLLWGEKISNREFMNYVGISSDKTALRLLKSLNLMFEGANRNRKYIIPSNIQNGNK